MAAVAVAQSWRQARPPSPPPRTARGPRPPSGGTAVARPLQREMGSISMGCPWHHPGLFPPHCGIPTATARSCPKAPTHLHWWHEARWLVGGLLHRRHPLWKRCGREAAVLAGVCIRLEQGFLVRLEQGVLVRLEQSFLVRSVPCRETTCGKVLGSLTQAIHQLCTCEQNFAHLRAPRMWPASQSCGERCHTAAAAPPEARAVWGRCFLRGSTGGRMSQSYKISPN